MSRFFILLLAPLLSALPATGLVNLVSPGPQTLSFKNGELLLKAQFDREPEALKEARMHLQFSRPQDRQAAILNERIDISLWMPALNLGSNDAVVERLLDAKGALLQGAYLVTRLQFPTAGIWEVRIKLTDEDGDSETRMFRVDLGPLKIPFSSR